MCIDTTCCTVVALNEAGEALRPALLWMDMRSAKQAAQVGDARRCKGTQQGVKQCVSGGECSKGRRSGKMPDWFMHL